MDLPLEVQRRFDQRWAARFGMLVDKFGVAWMVLAPA